MGAQIRTILVIVAILAVVGAVAVGLRYGLQEPEESATAGQGTGQAQRDTLASVPPTDGQPADEAAVPVGEAIPPSFDIVRVEPTGDLVAAGRAAGRAHVMLLHGDEELESADANAVGEWAIVLNEPLAPGSYDLLLRATGPDGKGGPVDGDRVTVVIEGPGRTPLVALVRPGEPMQVLQQPREETVVAASEAPVKSEPKPSSDAAGEDAVASAAGNGSADADATGTAGAGTNGAGTNGTAAPKAAAGQSEGAPPADGSSAGDQVASAQDQPNAAQGETSAGNQSDAPAEASTADTGAADVSQPAESTGTQTSDTQPSEDQSGGTQVAGGQPGDGQAVQGQTVDNQPAPGGDAGVQTAQASSGQPEPAEAGSEPIGAPATQPSTSQQQAADAGTDVGAGNGAQPSAEPGGNVSIKTVEVEDTDKLMLSGEAEPGDAVRLYLNNERLSDVETDAAGRWALSSNRPMPPGRYELRADVVGDAGDVKARAEVRFDRVQMVAEEDGNAAAGQSANGAAQVDAAQDEASRNDLSQAAAAGGAAAGGAPGSVVTIVSHAGGSGTAFSGGAVGEGAGTSVVMIARGDSLWRVARKIYGKGVRHSVIYEANKNQIRNPHLIYPGQVFTIPVLEGENG